METWLVKLQNKSIIKIFFKSPKFKENFIFLNVLLLYNNMVFLFISLKNESRKGFE